MSRKSENTACCAYIERIFNLDSNHYLQKVRSTAPKPIKGIQFSPLEGGLASFLLSIIDARRVLEIGTLVGYSTLWLAQAMRYGGYILSIEKSIEHYETALRNVQEAGLEQVEIDILNGDAIDLLSQLDSNIQFDAVLIDANKKNYLRYLELIEPYLKKGGLLIADNTLLFGYVYQDDADIPPRMQKLSQVIDKFNAYLANSKKYRSIMIPTEEGMTVAQKIV